MEIVIKSNADAAATLTAQLIAARVRAKPDLVLGLATGRTHRGGRFTRSSPPLRWISPAAAVSTSTRNWRAADRQTFLPLLHGRAAVRQDQHRQDQYPRARRHGFGPRRGSRALRAPDQGSKGIDLQLLGIGEDGHIGFNEPLSALMSRTREKALTPPRV